MRAVLVEAALPESLMTVHETGLDLAMRRHEIERFNQRWSTLLPRFDDIKRLFPDKEPHERLTRRNEVDIESTWSIKIWGQIDLEDVEKPVMGQYMFNSCSDSALTRLQGFTPIMTSASRMSTNWST